jgi:hypothetical protein
MQERIAQPCMKSKKKKKTPAGDVSARVVNLHINQLTGDVSARDVFGDDW